MKTQDLLQWFGSTEAITDHLLNAATIYVASKEFEAMEPLQRQNWHFKNSLLIKYFIARTQAKE